MAICQRLTFVAVNLVFFLPAFAQEPDIRSFAGEAWYGVYMNGEKAGFSSSVFEVADSGTVKVVEDVTFRLRMSGVKQDMRVVTTREFAADGTLTLIESSVDDTGGKKEFRVTVEGKTMTVRTRVGGNETVTTAPRPQESLADTLALERFVRSGPAVGASVTYRMYEPMYSTEIEGTSWVVSITERLLDGTPTKVFEIKSVLAPLGVEQTSFVAEDGTTLEDSLAGTITLRLEPKEIAMNVDYANDVIVANAAKLDKPLPDARTRESVTLDIHGPLAKEHFVEDGRQSFKQTESTVRFTGKRIAADAVKSVPLPITDTALLEWTKPSMFVQSDSPELAAKAKEIVGEETDALTVSSKLSEWVYRNVRSTYSARLTNSLEVLDTMEGDCTEHSMLFIGLARAAGIPAREVAGLIYAASPDPGFYFHQWATVWVGQWIDVDPTFNQPIADATHIKLAEGDLLEQARLLPVIGRLTIEVVE